MKTFFKKLNRGVLLSIVIILAIIGYYVALGVKSAPEKKLMLNTADGFFEEFSKYAVLTEREFDELPDNEETLEQRVGAFAEAVNPLFLNGKATESAKAVTRQMLNNQIVYRDTEYRNFRYDVEILKCRINFKKNTAELRLLVTSYYTAEHTEYDYNSSGQITDTHHWTEDCSVYGNTEEWSVTMTKSDDRWLIDDIGRNTGFYF